ncbi:MAG: penicillin-insensitive murein endopeptidase [Candidatus Tectimicrobiota bacterium]
MRRFCVMGFLGLLYVSTALAQDWRDVLEPALGPPRSVGSYTAGCLQGAQALPPDGPGFQTMRRYRRRFFGHPVLVRYLRDLADMASKQGLGTLSIGDLGQARGGPTPSGHRSHQTGLDVDVWFLLLPNGKKLSADEREKVSAPSVVSANKLHVDTTQWTPQHGQLLQMATRHDAVERIFVHAAIKQELCRQSPGAGWLQKLRPWWGHDDHFHVRLRCPAGDQECQKQEPIPAGDGCGAELAWWFTEEAHKPQPRTEIVKLALPAACDEILRR